MYPVYNVYICEMSRQRLNIVNICLSQLSALAAAWPDFNQNKIFLYNIFNTENSTSPEPSQFQKCSANNHHFVDMFGKFDDFNDLNTSYLSVGPIHLSHCKISFVQQSF